MKDIQYLVMDVDGTLTDGRIYMGNEGELVKAFYCKDGIGVHDIAIPAGLIPVIITGRASKCLENRCREMGVELLFQGVRGLEKKIEKLREVTADLSKVAYIGDDINDLSCMLPVKEAGGLVGAPCDAVKEVLAVADFVSEHRGGEGAVRDFIEWLLA